MLMLAAAAVPRHHDQRMDNGDLGGSEPRAQIGFMEVVHQEADSAAVHAVDRLAAAHQPMQGLQHEAVTAERDHHIGIFRRDIAVAGDEPLARALCRRARARDEPDPIVMGRGSARRLRGVPAPFGHGRRQTSFAQGW